MIPSHRPFPSLRVLLLFRSPAPELPWLFPAASPCPHPDNFIPSAHVSLPPWKNGRTEDPLPPFLLPAPPAMRKIERACALRRGLQGDTPERIRRIRQAACPEAAAKHNPRRTGEECPRGLERILGILGNLWNTGKCGSLPPGLKTGRGDFPYLLYTCERRRTAMDLKGMLCAIAVNIFSGVLLMLISAIVDYISDRY